jgi:hypothetical protein
VSGVQDVSAPASAPIACADRSLRNVRPQAPIRLTVRLGNQAARLRGIAVHPMAPFAVAGDLSVAVRAGSGRRWRTTSIGHGGPHLLSSVGSYRRAGYICLVRFHAGTRAVALVGLGEGCMSACPHFDFFPMAGPARRALSTGPLGATIDTSSGASVVVTGDWRFRGRFADGAESSSPRRVFTVDAGRVVNVSRDYPRHVSVDAALQWAYFTKSAENRQFRGRGELASWAADECTVGRQDFAWRVLDELANSGRLDVKADLHAGDAASYVHHVETFLIQTGYAT